MTELSKLLDEALVVTRAAMPGPWESDEDGEIYSADMSQDQGNDLMNVYNHSELNAIIIWRQLAEPLLNVAKAAKAHQFYCDDPSHGDQALDDALTALHQAAEDVLK